MTEKSLDAVQKEVDWLNVEQSMDPEKLWNLFMQKHKVQSMSEVEAVVKLAVRMQLATIGQGAYESIFIFKHHYTNALKA